MKPHIELVWFSSLVKLPPYTAELPSGCKKGQALRGESFHCQLMFRSREMHNRVAKVEVVSDLPFPITLREIGYVPVLFTGYFPCDADVISSEAGIYPDKLLPMKDNSTRFIVRQSKTLWLTADIPENCPAGTYPIRLKFTVEPDECDGWGGLPTTQKTEYFETPAFQLTVLPATLPAPRMKVTQWFHPDCLAAVYNVPMWSEEHWEIMKNYMQNAAKHGMNMILTPLFTLLLNVMPGQRRALTQLLIITRKNGKYQFDFSRFDRYINLAKESGIRYFEIAHLFSQWGAVNAPPIEVDGEILFDGTQLASSPEYREFLAELLPALRLHLKKLGILKQTVFHCSDEPQEKHAKAYHDAISALKKHLPDCRVIDAINNTEVFHNCEMDTPVPLTNDLYKFQDIPLKERWTYYCCGPTDEVPNRFIHWPSSRNRIIGVLLWMHRIDGFLHWGYNFYFEALSRFLLDPEKDSTCNSFYPPGDSFLVYPGNDGAPLDSIRHEVFFDALQDIRALDLLTELTSREYVEKTLLRWCKKLTMTQYPRGEKAVLNLRTKINQEILKKLK